MDNALSVMAATYLVPTLKSRVYASLGFALFIGWAYSNSLWMPKLAEYIRCAPLCESLPWVRGGAAYFMALPLVFSLLCARRAKLTLRNNQAPPPEAWVWVRTRVRTGKAATASGCLWAATAVAFACGPGALAHFFGLSYLLCIAEPCGCP